MRRAIPVLLLVAGCAAAAPDPRPGFTRRNVGQTLVTQLEGGGTQAAYLAPDGGLYVWSSASPQVQRGSWRYDLLATEAAKTYQGSGGVNYPVQELATEWGVCFQDREDREDILHRPQGGDWTCTLLAEYEALVAGRAPGDAFGLTDGTPPAAMPDGRQMTVEQLLTIEG